MRIVKTLAVVAALSPMAAMADTNLDALITQVGTGFASAAGLSVIITVFFIARRLVRKGAN